MAHKENINIKKRFQSLIHIKNKFICYILHGIILLFVNI